MAWKIVIQPNGKYARFSTVMDDFTHCELSEEDARKLCAEELHNTDKMRAAHDEPERFEESLDTVRFCHGEDLADARRKEMT